MAIPPLGGCAGLEPAQRGQPAAGWPGVPVRVTGGRLDAERGRAVPKVQSDQHHAFPNVGQHLAADHASDAQQLRVPLLALRPQLRGHRDIQQGPDLPPRAHAAAALTNEVHETGRPLQGIWQDHHAGLRRLQRGHRGQGQGITSRHAEGPPPRRRRATTTKAATRW